MNGKSSCVYRLVVLSPCTGGRRSVEAEMEATEAPVLYFCPSMITPLFKIVQTLTQKAPPVRKGALFFKGSFDR